MRAAVVDAFTDRAFAGNPAAVVWLDPEAPTPALGWMQRVASEFGLSETAFVSPLGPGQYRLRWFTPTVEVELCGHATLATAHWLLEQGLETGPMTFRTMSGRLSADGSPGDVRIGLPLVPVGDRRAPDGFEQAMGFLSYELVGFTDQSEALQRNALVLVDAVDLRDMQLNLRKLAQLPLGGVIATAAADDVNAAKGVDVLSRYFAPALGIDEDPVTGSAHCTLADYWCGELGRRSFRAAQVSERGGLLDVELDDSRDEPLVLLRGGAVTTMEVTLRV
ncbi:PhzF family phenazine biosynthesis isomerase [Aquipuribacter nitratireducens]|uniref:PhzF family phenazine biosynthesis protein n=1 Tax=Aquipuribacter nitratireducens TaxID=650104 RepID=A0ABW0GHZ6_9MICO